MKAVAAQKQGLGVVVVVSAMAKETDRLLGLCAMFSSEFDRAESDVISCTGEMVSSALMSLAIQSLGVKSRSFLGHQLPILTDSEAGQAHILSINTNLLLERIHQGEIPVVAGFQGIDKKNRVTTLGRGGSDTTAVAIAAAIKTSTCEIYTDVDGVYTADPRTLKSAKRLPNVSYPFMIEASGLGAKVMHHRSVILGQHYQVPIKVKSSFADGEGTEIGNLETHSRAVTVMPVDSKTSRVSLIGDFVATTSELITDALNLLDRQGIASLGSLQGKMSFSSLVSESRAEEAASIFHTHYVEQLCY